VLKLVLGLIATLTALVLGLLISSGYSAYQLQRAEIRDLATRIFEIDRTLARFGPETTVQRQELKQMLVTAVDRIWPANGVEPAPQPNGSVQLQGEALFIEVAGLPATSNLQRLAQNRAMQLLENVSVTWHLLVMQTDGSLSAHILWVLACWLIVLFFGFGLLTTFNATVGAAFCVGSASVGAAVLLIVDLNQPYVGWMQLPKAALTTVLAQMGH
jgi:hypothetical protein